MICDDDGVKVDERNKAPVQRFRQASTHKFETYDKASAFRNELKKCVNTVERVRVRRRADGTFDVVTYERLPCEG